MINRDFHRDGTMNKPTIQSIVVGILAVTAIAGTTAITESIQAFAQELTATTTINSARLNLDGSVTVEYTVYCSVPSYSYGATVSVTQSAGKFGEHKVSSSSGSTGRFECDENGTPLTATVMQPAAGFFTPGKATVHIFAYIYRLVGIGSLTLDTTQTIHLRR